MFIDKATCAIQSKLFARDVIGTAESFKSWDTCMDNRTCKIVAIVLIALGGVLLLWILSSIIRCMCCGVACVSSFCCCFSSMCGCCGGSKSDFEKDRRARTQEFPPSGSQYQPVINQPLPQVFDKNPSKGSSAPQDMSIFTRPGGSRYDNGDELPTYPAPGMLKATAPPPQNAAQAAAQQFGYNNIYKNPYNDAPLNTSDDFLDDRQNVVDLLNAGQSGDFKAQPTGYLSQPTGFLSQPTGFLSQPTGFLSQPTGFLSQPTGYQPQQTGYQPPDQYQRSNNIPMHDLSYSGSNPDTNHLGTNPTSSYSAIDESYNGSGRQTPFATGPNTYTQQTGDAKSAPYPTASPVNMGSYDPLNTPSEEPKAKFNAPYPTDFR